MSNFVKRFEEFVNESDEAEELSRQLTNEQRSFLKDCVNATNGIWKVDENDNIEVLTGRVYINGNKFDGKKLPVKFGRVKMFSLYDVPLETLEGCPDYVEMDFHISHCDNIKTLEFGPEVVKGIYTCINCNKIGRAHV